MIKSNKGFTLIELIAVIAILLVISVLAVVNLGNLTGGAENAAVIADARALVSQMNMSNSLATGNGPGQNGYIGPPPTNIPQGNPWNPPPTINSLIPTVSGNRIHWTLPRAYNLLRTDTDFEVVFSSEERVRAVFDIVEYSEGMWRVRDDR
ncbi:MAG: type II secretion system GspH family protein [Defluviitaleaceae bacterium]|nr:type II secretion system GspH family protein [Defluviitaleaceae bacterium]